MRAVLNATGLPLMVFGPGQAELDNELLVAVAEEAAGERLVLGVCEDKNYRTIAAAAMAHGHLVDSRTPMDVNLAKQLIILTRDVGLPMDRILMDPSTGALGYGIEYGYSVMERLRLAALNGDSMTQQPMLVTPGEEGWKLKESKVGSGVPEAWGDWAERAVTWETLTATTLLQSGADIVVLAPSRQRGRDQSRDRAADGAWAERELVGTHPMNDQPTTAQPEVTIEELIAAISHQIEVTHGGWVEFVDFDGKTLQVRLQGACIGCPMSQQTLAMGIGRFCKQYFPEMEYIQAVP